jgi:hypothetical protein
MFCSNCGSLNNDDAKFCVNCGESLSEVIGKKRLSRSRHQNAISSVMKVDFLPGLFDLTFNDLVTSKLVPFLYGLSLLLAGIVAVLLIIVGFHTSTIFGILALLIGAPLLFLLTVIWSRVSFEMTMTLFRMAEQMGKKGEKPESKENVEWNV